MAKKKTSEQRIAEAVRRQYSGPEHFELSIKKPELMETYLRGAPTQRTTALGSAIERHSIMGEDSMPCSRCRGAGVLYPRRGERRVDEMLRLITDDETVIPACRFDELISGRDSGEYLDREIVNDLAIHRGVSPDEVLKAFTPFCPKCRGNAYVPIKRRGSSAVNVHSTGSSKPPWRNYDERVSELTAFGRSSKLMRRLDPTHQLALEHYFGFAGEWCAGKRWGRVMAVAPMTNAGGRLLVQTRNLAGTLDPWERIWSVYTDSDKTRIQRALLDSAASQGVKLLKEAGRSWDDVVTESGAEGLRLRAARRHRGMTQAELAAAVGATAAVIADIESGLEIPTQSHSDDVMTACGLARDWRPLRVVKGAA